MKKQKVIILLGLSLLALCCKKDNKDIMITDSLNYKSNIFGLVIDEMNAPIQGATVV